MKKKKQRSSFSRRNDLFLLRATRANLSHPPACALIFQSPPLAPHPAPRIPLLSSAFGVTRLSRAAQRAKDEYRVGDRTSPPALLLGGLAGCWSCIYSDIFRSSELACHELTNNAAYRGVGSKAACADRPAAGTARIMIEFQRGAFRVFTGCTGFRRGAKEFLAARDSFVSRPLVPLSPCPVPVRFFQSASFIAGAHREQFIPIALSVLYR